MTGAENTWREVTLDSGYYQTSQELINAINMAIYEENITATYSVSSRRIVMNIQIGTSLQFNEPLSSMLGIGYERTVCTNATTRGRFLMNLSRGIDSLYIYTDLVQTKLVGGTATPLLSIVPIQGTHGEMVFKEYSTPVYSNLSRIFFLTIEIYLKYSAGRDIPFAFGKVKVLLHFKKIQ